MPDSCPLAPLRALLQTATMMANEPESLAAQEDLDAFATDGEREAFLSGLSAWALVTAAVLREFLAEMRQEAVPWQRP